MRTFTSPPRREGEKALLQITPRFIAGRAPLGGGHVFERDGIAELAGLAHF